LGQPLRYKYAALGLPKDAIARPRLDRLLTELFDTYSVVEIIAAPGSGKTVQAQLFAQAYGRQLAWLTLDRTDASASALVFDLAAALGPLAGNAVEAMRDTLSSNGTAEEAAAVLASSTDREDALLVVDECQQVGASADAASALATFLEYVPERLRVLLLARDELPWPLQKRSMHGRIAQLTDSTLNLTLAETASYVRETGGKPDEIESIYAATDGWAAGVALASRFGVGETPNLRDLSAYFEHQVLCHLPNDEQAFLRDTSVARVVTPDVAEALCGPDGRRLWGMVFTRHLPVTSTSSNAIVIHSLLHSYLYKQLAQDPQRRKEQMHRYAEYLTDARQHDDAAEAWLSVGNLERAHESAVETLPALAARSDWPRVMRWLDAFGEPVIYSDPRLIAAYVRGVHGTRDFEDARTLVRKLDREGRLRAAVESDPALLATAAWALQADPPDALRLLDKYQGDARADVVRYTLEATVGTLPIAPPNAQDPGDVQRLLSWGMFLQGRLSEIARMVSPEDASPLLNPNLVLAPVLQHDPETAAKLWQRVPHEIRERPHSQFIAALLALAIGDRAEARHRLLLAVAGSQRSGFSLEAVYEIFLGYLHLTDDGPDAALRRLEPVLDEVSRAGKTAYVEIAQCFLGMTYLRCDRVTEARLMLHEAVTSMTRAQRRLQLPMAAVALSEAEARLGNAEAASRTAEYAYRVSMLTGSYSVLVHGIRIFPGVRRRQLARDSHDSRWQRLVAAPSVRQPSPGPAHSHTNATLVLQPFGRARHLVVDGTPTNVGRTKVLELVACLSLHPNGIDRFQLQQRLFPEADQRSGGNHFRQIAHKLRHMTNVNLERRDSLIMFSRSLAFTAEDIESERILRTASSCVGQERLARLEHALAPVCGPYLEGSLLSWVEERRNYLELVYEEARLELAMLHLDLGNPDAGREQCERVLEKNRYSDPAYRILVEIERMVGSESSVLAVYRRANDALAELGLRPGDARRLLNRTTAARGEAAV
jgi:DNA-binding SARP family transcriptional activator